ncbi:HAD-superfamily hydrolase, subfamily IA, variant 3 [Nostocoides japonicum T1-X7]|uniref:HAD-superfamily hydrolase, subfamily IA, variant 3 n=1 Tax=Nostocoides japonicum T1-X7 TaxID=1194083 RepID=A0A077LUR7_9MICO|nr:HAD family hydrolase [Tetrasphaera japonica]CCH77638.1 HAD-superfamily hydrolase, subfamily IA, variant 3 [Tetrasphaera japonica T1-X7]
MTRTGVLFDVDGTLVDTAYIHAVCWSRALEQNGFHRPTSVVHRAVGMGAERLVTSVLGEDLPSEELEAVVAAHAVLYAEWHSRVRAFDSAADLVRACAVRGLVVVLASSAGEHELAVLRGALGADDAIDVATSSDDAAASKPAPDILAAALERADLTPDSAVFVGDAVWDVEACRRIGMPCVGVECGGTSSRGELLAAGAAEVWRDPSDLLAHLEDSAVGRLIGR